MPRAGKVGAMSRRRIGYEGRMGKSTGKPILAAGGIVVREGAKPRLAIVRRRRDDAWVLPKGKLKAKERPIAAAKREVREETGCTVRIKEFLGVISYRSGGATKVAHFWRMRAVGEARAEPMDDISAVKWVSFTAAVARLSLAHERQFLRSIGRKALRRPPVKKARRRKRKTRGRNDCGECQIV